MNRFDEILDGIRRSEPEPAELAAASARVQQTLFGPGSAAADQLRGCDDFRTLFPAYLQKTLSDARRMLLEDHLHGCVACRRALEQTRGGDRGKLRAMPVASPGGPARIGAPRWAIAAGVAAVLGVSALAARFALPSAFHTGTVARVESVDGMVYRVADAGNRALGIDSELAEGDTIRTPSGAHAMVRLWDGSRVEMNGRAELSVDTGWRGTTIRLERGQIIVQAARQKQGHLFVAAGDSRVAVKGTIFSVNRGTLGSRVSVVEGQVEVAQNGRTESLKPGDQTTTDPALAKVPVEAEVNWSRDAARYLALLGEFEGLQRNWARLPGQGLRYQSRLLVYVPEDTVMVAALPNLGTTLREAKRLFDDRVRMSEVLRQWWMDPANREMRQGVEEFLEVVQELAAMVGDEVLMTVGGTKGHDMPLLLAEARSPNLAAALDKLAARAGGGHKPVYAIRNNILILAANARQLAAVEAAIARGGSPATPFRRRVEQAYREGAGYLIAANMEQIMAGSVRREGSQMDSLGFNSAQYLVAERREIAGKTENRAALTFAGERKGIPAWLAAPSAMSTLQFVTPDAGAAFSFVVKQPRSILEELLDTARRNGADFDRSLAEVEARLGIRILDDIGAALGAEATFAIDGPLLPVPSWKIAAEVNSPQRLQSTIEKLIAAYNRENPKAPPVTITRETANGRQFTVIKGGRLPTEVHYTFVDSYILMAPSRAMLTLAIQNRQTGLTLVRSEKFRSNLPYATNPNFSAMIYHNLGGTVAPIVDTLESFANVTPAQRQAMRALKDAQPGLITLHAEADRITAATNGVFAGFNLGMFTGFGDGKSNPIFSRQ